MTPGRIRLLLTALTIGLLTAGSLAAQRGNRARVVSPDVSDGNATLRLRAPAADAVRVTSGGDIPGVPGGGLDLTRNDDGVWEVTLENIDSGAYRYNFNVDGVSTLDPSNPLTSQSNGSSWSLFYVSGSDFMDERRVPHGAIAEVSYFSETHQRHRRMHVYTPPGYQTNDDRYPVFYLLHGAGDSDDAWSTVGRAGFILDNLIASGTAEPMIVVMPDGHTTGPNAPAPQAAFETEFVTDIKPYVETHFRVRTDRAATAIAGLSMGGGQTLEIGITDLDEYAYIGVFSSGVFSIGRDTSFEETHADTLDAPSLREGLELVWFSTGREDGLLDTTQQTVAMLREHGFDVVFEESTGGHTWINWREYLREFTPQLFH